LSSLPSIPLAGEVTSASFPYDLIVDAIFGFSFDASKPGIRAPYDTIIQQLATISSWWTPTAGVPLIPIISVDVPSGM
jgi:NAD(P)H-hydrate repair Nnr-like enzyme with NAD(P)H-hydrate epimerase domain